MIFCPTVTLAGVPVFITETSADGLTVTVKLQLALLPQLSLAVTLTVVVPTLETCCRSAGSC